MCVWFMPNFFWKINLLYFIRQQYKIIETRFLIGLLTSLKCQNDKIWWYTSGLCSGLCQKLLKICLIHGKISRKHHPNVLYLSGVQKKTKSGFWWHRDVILVGNDVLLVLTGFYVKNCDIPVWFMSNFYGNTNQMYFIFQNHIPLKLGFWLT